MIVRFVDHAVGVHVRIDVFTAVQPEGVGLGAFDPAYQKVGEMVMRPDEWAIFRVLLLHGPGDLQLPRDGSINVEVHADE